MPKCHLCGYEYGDEARYCAQCGTKVNGLEVSAMPTLPGWAKAEELLKFSGTLSLTLDMDLLFKKVRSSAARLTSANASSVMLLDEDRESLCFRSSSGEKADILRSLSVKDGIAWWVAQHGETARVDDVANDERYTGTIDKITGFKTKSILCVPMILDNRVIGVMEVLNKVNGTGFTDEDERLLSALADQAAVAVKNAELAMQQRNFFTHVIEILVKAVEATRLVPEGHCWRVAKLANAMGRKLGMEDQELQNLYYAAALHDLGMLNLRQGEAEQEIRMESHPVLGANMVRTIDILHGTESIIHHHHEYFDGSGYPGGLKGEEIPLGARIIGVLEAYEQAISEGEERRSAKAEIKENAGKLFDPVLVDVFLELIAFSED